DLQNTQGSAHPQPAAHPRRGHHLGPSRMSQCSPEPAPGAGDPGLLGSLLPPSAGEAGHHPSTSATPPLPPPVRYLPLPKTPLTTNFDKFEVKYTLLMWFL
uniref:Uncharacterized protein n=1 Tax=Cyprinus carpio TaxID=7962 RepID=A0A8C1GVA5_CYPCA